MDNKQRVVIARKAAKKWANGEAVTEEERMHMAWAWRAMEENRFTPMSREQFQLSELKSDIFALTELVMPPERPEDDPMEQLLELLKGIAFQVDQIHAHIVKGAEQQS